MDTVIHDDRVTAFEVADRSEDGTPALFVHGSGGTHEIWKSQFARLSGDRPIVGLDLAGHGESGDVDTEPGPETMAAYVEDTLAVAEATDAGILVGNSLGGAVVLTALIERDPDVDAAVLVGSGAKLAVLEDLRTWLENDFDRAVDFLHGDDRLFHDPDPRLDQLSRETMRQVGRRITSRDFLTSHAFDERDRLDQITVPTLAITGEHDGLTPPSYHEYLAAHISQGTYEILPDAAHLSMLETPSAFNEALADFWERL